MNKRLVGVFIFAFIVAAAASLVLYKLIAARLATADRPVNSEIIVATHELAVGTLIREQDIKRFPWAGSMPAHALARMEDAVGRGVIATIYDGEPVLETRLAPKGAGAGLAATIPVGMRAVAVRVNEVVGLAGFVTPGMRVDILILGNPPGAGGNMGTQAKTLLQNIEVLSAGQQIQKDVEGKPVSVPVVNLLVTPEQAEILSLASSDARIQLILRNPLDHDESKTSGTALTRLFTGEAPKPPAEPRSVPRPRPVARSVPPPPAPEKAPEAIIVEVIHGAKKAATEFEEKLEEH